MHILYFIHHGRAYCEHCAAHPPQGRIADLDELATPVFEDSVAGVDAPKHCHQCTRFLPTPLTVQGVEHVIERLRNFDPEFDNSDALTQWVIHYANEIERHPDVDLLIRDGFHALYINLADDERQQELLNDLRDCARPGDAESPVRHVLDTYRIVASPDIRLDLTRAGCDPDTLDDHERNILRFVWDLAHQVRDNPDWFPIED